MLLVSMGTQPIQCERIINTIINADIKDEIIIQSYYKNEKNIEIPDNVKILETIPYDEMNKYIERADIIVVSGTGSIFRALKNEKKIIIFPRLGTYNEAIGNHGLDMKALADAGYAEFVQDEKDFMKAYNKCLKTTYKKFVSNTTDFIAELTKQMKEL